MTTAASRRAFAIRFRRKACDRYGLEPVPDDPTAEELAAFLAALVVAEKREQAKADKAARVCFGGKLTWDERNRLHQAHPGFGRLTADQLLAAGRTGRKGDVAVRYALRRMLPASPVTAAAPAARPRERRSTSRTRARAPDGDREPPPPVALVEGVTLDLGDLVGYQAEPILGDRALIGRVWDLAGDGGRLRRRAEPGTSLEHLAVRLCNQIDALDATVRPTAGALVAAGVNIDRALELVDRHVTLLHDRLGGKP